MVQVWHHVKHVEIMVIFNALIVLVMAVINALLVMVRVNWFIILGVNMFSTIVVSVIVQDMKNAHIVKVAEKQHALPAGVKDI